MLMSNTWGVGKNPKTLSSLNPERYIVKVHEEGRKRLSEEIPGNLGPISPKWWEQAMPQGMQMAPFRASKAASTVASQVAQVVKNQPARAGDVRCRLDPWVRKIPWRKKWQPTSVFLPAESHGQRNLEGYSRQRVGQDWAGTHPPTHTHTYTHHIVASKSQPAKCVWYWSSKLWLWLWDSWILGISASAIIASDRITFQRWLQMGIQSKRNQFYHILPNVAYAVLGILPWWITAHVYSLHGLQARVKLKQPYKNKVT